MKRESGQLKTWLKIAAFLSCFVILAACGTDSPDKVVKKVEKAWGNHEGYTLLADMEMQAGGQTKAYEIEVWHTKPELYRVEVVEKDSDTRQIIVKNEEGVYVVAPSLNKTYEFQSEWPTKNSQAYFIHTLINDLKSDENRKMKETENQFEFEVATQNNEKTGLPLQKIQIDKKSYAPVQVTLFNEAGEEKIKIAFSKVNFEEVHSSKEYAIDTETKSTGESTETNSKTTDESTETNSKSTDESTETKDKGSETTYYPAYEFANTKLVDEKVIKDGDNLRVILTYEGDKRFTLMQESAVPNDAMIPVFAPGEIAQVGGVFGSVTENSLSWEENGKSFFLASHNLSMLEMVEVANSMTENSLK